MSRPMSPVLRRSAIAGEACYFHEDSFFGCLRCFGVLTGLLYSLLKNRYPESDNARVDSGLELEGG
jgi:hypothetical protein